MGKKCILLLLIGILVVSFVGVGGENIKDIKLTDPLPKPILDYLRKNTMDRAITEQAVTTSSYDYTYSTTHFRVHYNICADDSCVSQAFAQKVGTYLEAAWTRYMNELGFLQPPDMIIDVNIDYFLFVGGTEYTGGQLTIMITSLLDPYNSCDVDTNCETALDYALKFTTAHELFHCIQTNYDLYEDSWIIEGTANSMGDKVYDSLNYYFEYLYNDFYEPPLLYPDADLTDATDIEHAYAAVLFFKFLEERYGTGSGPCYQNCGNSNCGVDIIKTVLQKIQNYNGIEAMQHVMATKGTTFENAFLEYLTNNHAKDSGNPCSPAMYDYCEDEEQGYNSIEWVGGYPSQTITYSTTLNSGGNLNIPNDGVNGWGADYYKINLGAGISGVQISFNGASGSFQDFGVRAVFVKGNTIEIGDLILDVNNDAILQKANNAYNYVMIIVSGKYIGGTYTLNVKTISIECGGTDTSCGISPNCVNCNLQDGCNGDYYRNYYCSSNSAGCSYTSDNCNDCSCSCGNYGKANESGFCSDGKDNDCDGKTDGADSDCVTCTDECSSGSKRCSGNYSQSCGNYDADSCLEWGNNVDCGADSCGSWGSNYCKNDDVYHSRTCNDKGCSSGNCFNNSFIEEQIVQDCQYGCSNGQCKSAPINCSNNNDCNDSNAYTADSCVNPGTPQSYCLHEQIVCLTKADCGVDGFIGNKFCQNNDVYQNYQTFTCINPGTKQSNCSASASPQLVQDCQYGCSNGQCISCNCSSWVNGQCGAAGGCADGQRKQTRTCTPSGCQAESQCVNDNTCISCTDECTSGQKQCSGNYSQSCGNYDADSCLEWGGDILCQYGCSAGTCIAGGGLVSYWKFEDNVLDSVDSHHGTNYRVSFVAGICGKAASFAGTTSSYIILPNKVLEGKEKFSVGMWIKSSGSGDGIFSVARSGQANELLIGEQNSLGIWVKGSTKKNTGLVLNNNSWHYIVVTINSPEGKSEVYVDGKLKKTFTISKTPLQINGIVLGQDQDSVLGGFSSSQSYKGLIDELKIWSRILSQDEIKAEYNSCISPACSKNSDCGTDAWLNQNFCSGGNVYDKWRAWTCSNPGTSQAACSYTDVNKLKQSCQYGCTNGQCNPASCTSNSNCLTEQFCKFNSGCIPPGLCTQKPAACPFLYDPVCGCNNKDYPNECAANFEGVNVKHKGSCVTCTDECSSGSKRCSGNSAQTCGNYDADSCLEWGSNVDCPDGCTNGQCNGQPKTIIVCKNCVYKNVSSALEIANNNDVVEITDKQEYKECILLNKTNLTLNCNQATINGSGCYWAIEVSANKVTVKNCKVVGALGTDRRCYGCPAILVDGNESKIINNTLTGNSAGLILDSEDSLVLDNQIYENLDFGIYGIGYRCNISNNLACFNQRDIWGFENSTSYGIGNTCDNAVRWNDQGKIGCTYPCPCRDECSSGSKRCSGNSAQTCGNYDADSCLEWGNNVDCGADSCGSWGNNYCKNDDVYHSRTCNDKGCTSGNCFNNSFIEEQIVQDCQYSCSAGNCTPRGGLVSYWKFEDNVLDSAGTNNGTNNGAVFVAGKKGKAISFDGTNDYVKILKSSSLSLLTGANKRTISAWVKVNTWATNKGVWSVGRASSHEDFSLEIESTKGDLTLNHWFDDLSFKIPSNYSDWHLITIIYNGTDTLAYVDGIFRGGKKVALKTYNSDFHIGHSLSHNTYFNGQVDELKIWNKTLTQAEIIAEYNSV